MKKLVKRTAASKRSVTIVRWTRSKRVRLGMKHQKILWTKIRWTHTHTLRDSHRTFVLLELQSLPLSVSIAGPLLSADPERGMRTLSRAPTRRRHACIAERTSGLVKVTQMGLTDLMPPRELWTSRSRRSSWEAGAPSVADAHGAMFTRTFSSCPYRAIVACACCAAS